MRVLLVAYLFPPYNTIGAVRSGKAAAYLARFGHDVRVLSAAEQPLQATLPLEIPAEHVAYTPWLNVNRPVELLTGGRQRVAAQGFAPGGRHGRLLRPLGALYKTCFHLPDGQIGWLPFAVRAGRRLIDGWSPDVILASAKPLTCLLVARRLAAHAEKPWVAELRDLWTDNPYDDRPAWRRWLESRWEHRVLSTAAGLVTVSEPLADVLRTKYDAPVEVVLNGFDAEDYPPPSPRARDDKPLRIVYTGMIYEGRRDPTPLFAALARLGPRAERVRVQFYGRYLDVAARLAAAHGVERLVETRPSVPYRESLRLQSEADVLLLLLWNSPHERGVYTGKLFEYLGARRPILTIGGAGGVAARLIADRRAGVVSDDPGAIATSLSAWLDEKARSGTIAPLDAQATSGLSREEQVRRLERFLQTAGERAPPAGWAHKGSPTQGGRMPAEAPGDTVRRHLRATAFVGPVRPEKTRG